jgi:hypothetical protein
MVIECWTPAPLSTGADQAGRRQGAGNHMILGPGLYWTASGKAPFPVPGEAFTRGAVTVVTVVALIFASASATWTGCA